MIIKIDLEKVYDRLECIFVRTLLNNIGFYQETIKLIVSCISSTATSIFFNCTKLEEFKPSRGIRQGNPISPYIFILCMEFLGALINKKCVDREWDKVKALKNGPRFSHMFFADDLLLFAKANTQNCNAIEEVLEEFYGLSGQKVSQEKSKNFFSPNVPEDTRDTICNQLQIKATCDLGRYLGFPILRKGRNIRAFQFVFERIQSKLEGWKSKLLSPASRLVLINSTATPIPGYFM